MYLPVGGVGSNDLGNVDRGSSAVNGNSSSASGGNEGSGSKGGLHFDCLVVGCLEKLEKFLFLGAGELKLEY